MSRESVRTQRIMDQFIRRLHGSKSYSCHIIEREVISLNDVQIQAQETYTLAARRSDRLTFINPSGTSLWSGADRVVTFNPLSWQYSQEKNTSNERLWQSETHVGAIEDIPLLDFILSSAHWRLFKAQPFVWEQLDDEAIGGVNCHHITVSMSNIPVHMWFEAEGDNNLKQIAVAIQMPVSDKADAGVMNTSGNWTFADWTFDTELDEAIFEKDIPADAWPHSDNPIAGKPAPPLSAPLLGGGTMDLGQHLGKQIVVLDFWASWCGPCRKSLPVLDRLRRGWNKDEVAVYAVNIESKDTPEMLQQFVQDNRLQLPVVLGHDSNVGATYRVSTIPQTVVVGKNGIVQTVHIGNAAAELQRDVAALLEGKEKQGILAAPRADVSCSKYGFTSHDAGKPLSFWCELHNAGPDDLPAGRLAMKLSLAEASIIEDDHLVDKPLPAGTTLRYEVPVETWGFEFKARGKSKLILELDPYKAVNDPKRGNNKEWITLTVKE